MKANFALSLSFDGLRLLHRAAGGWRLVGTVALDDADLNDALSSLRRTALDLDPSGLRTKLILPTEQIKYTSIDTGNTPPEDLRRAAEAALDGATPYAVSELAFDLSPDGARTHIAAVAEETLAEAEAFALEHRFEPISFVAIPDGAGFLGEPFFGATAHASSLLAPGDDIEPDGVAVVEIGAIEETSAPVLAVEDSTPATPVQDPPHDLSGYEVADEADISAPIPALGGASRDVPPMPTSGVLSGSLPGSEPAPVSAVPPAPGSFVSRRGGQGRLEPIPPAPRAPEFDATPEPEYQAAAYTADPAPAQQDSSERRRMTIFGAREPEVAGGAITGGKPRYLGLMLTALLILFLAGVAAWASVFMREDGGVSRFFAPRPPDPAPETLVEAPDLGVAPKPADLPQAQLITASLTDTLPLDQDAPRALATPTPGAVFDPEEAQAHYAITGIWTIPPVVPNPPGLMSLDDLYMTSIDRANLSFDAVALMPQRSFLSDREMRAPSNPAPPGISFALDSRGLVVPTPEGAVSPDGVLVFLGKPPLVPPPTPDRAAVPEQAEDAQPAPQLAAFRPRSRPENLVENTERQQLGGLSRAELADFRPRLRPQTSKQVAEEDETPTEHAIATSYRPNARPRNFARTVARATKQAEEAAPAPTQQVAAVAPRVVQPKIPSRSSVTKEATVNNAIRLNRINLMGVYGTPSNRRALVRLSNGRYKKLKVGDRLDGGRVSAIGEGELRYKKGKRSVVLKMPKT